MYPVLFKIPGINFAVPSYGALVLLSFLGATLWCARRAVKFKADPDIVLNVAFLALIFSAMGGRTLYVIHHWDQFADNLGQIINLRAGGFEFYGGLIGAVIPIFLYLWIKGLSIRLYSDIVTPALLLGMGIGRIGCFLFGCCWGGACPASLPWAVEFPFSSPPHKSQWENRLVTVPAELIVVDDIGRGEVIPGAVLKPTTLARLQEKLDKADADLAKAKASGDQAKIELAEATQHFLNRAVKPFLNHFDSFEADPGELGELAKRLNLRTVPVHPAQIYGAIGPLLLAFLASAYSYRRKRHGLVPVMGLMLYAVQRFCEEAIRNDLPLDTFGLTVSQAISIALFLFAIAVWLILRQLPLRSSRAVAFVPAKT